MTEVKGLMGTRFAVRAWVQSTPQERALKESLSAVAELEIRWSPWIEGSDIWELNAGAGEKAIKVASDTFALLQRSVDLCVRSRRAFDPTFFSLKSIYDLKKTPFVPPTPALLKEALPKVDCRKLLLEAGGQAKLQVQGMKLHLGGNAKGTALDRAASILRDAGIERFVVDGGGDVVVQGEGPKGPWRVGIQHPREKAGTLTGLVRSAGGAVATSGDYERFVVIDGRRYHHIVDPRTGQPAAGCMSATVTMPAGPHAGENADGLATVLCVRGFEASRGLLRAYPGAEAAVISPDGVVHKTPGFAGALEWTTTQPAP